MPSQLCLSVPPVPHSSMNVTPLTPTPHGATIQTEGNIDGNPEPKLTPGETFHVKEPWVPDSRVETRSNLMIKRSDKEVRHGDKCLKCG